MERFEKCRGVAAVLIRDNIDTDAIIPSREIKAVSKVGLAGGLFSSWRYTEPEQRIADPEFVLNRPEQSNTSILLAGENFGCGSSREHAVWALAEFGIRVIIAPSFGSIFYNNCVRNGVLPVILDKEAVATIAREIAADPQGSPVVVDLVNCTVSTEGGLHFAFSIGELQREMLISGLDPIGLTLEKATAISAYETRDCVDRPWVYLDQATR